MENMEEILDDLKAGRKPKAGPRYRLYLLLSRQKTINLRATYDVYRVHAMADVGLPLVTGPDNDQDQTTTTL